jgi:outer membrane protein assembly factor BamB
MQPAEPFQIFAVVPIFTNLGATILPMVLAAIGSALAIIFRPRELLRLCRENPAAVSKSIAVLAVFALCAFLGYHFLAGDGTKRAVAAHPHFDWATIAENLIAQEHAGKIASTSPNTPPSGTNDAANVVRPPVASSTSATNSPTAPEHLTLLWRFQPDDTMFLAKPAVFADRIYVAGCQSELGSYVGVLACLGAETGQPLWQASEFGDEPLKPFFSSPALTADGKYLVIGQGLHQDRDCSLLCFDTSNGKLQWSVKTPLHIESSPVVQGDLAIVGAGAIEGKDGQPTSDPGFVFAVRISDGMQVWRQPVNDPESSPTIDGDGITYIGSGFNGSAVVALRSEGDDLLRKNNAERIKWRRGLDCPIIGVILAGNLVVANGGNGDLVHSNRNARGLVSALDKATGEIRWSTQFADSVLGAVAVHDDRVFCPARTGEIVALALANGEQLWRTPLSGNAPILAGCVAHGERVLAVSSDGYLGVLDAETGKVIEKVYLNDQAKPSSGLTASTPLLLGDRMIVGSETGGIRCYVGAELGK